MRFGKNRVIDSILLPDLRRRSDCRESSFIEYIHHIAGYDGLWRGITVLFHKNYSRLFFIKEVFMLNKLLRSIGIGSARIDTVLKDSTVVPGSYLRGEVRITGGNAAQEIECIYMALVTDYEIEVDDSAVNRSFQLAKTRLCDRFVVQEGQDSLCHSAFSCRFIRPYQWEKARFGFKLVLTSNPQSIPRIAIMCRFARMF